MSDACPLLWLAFLLTGEQKVSENALLKALDYELTMPEVVTSRLESLTTSVVGEALSAIAIRLAASARRMERQIPSLDSQGQQLPEPAWCSEHDFTGDILEPALLAIDLFPRCVLLLTVFQKYSLDHVTGLLGTTKRLAQAAQTIALIELSRNIAVRQGWHPTPSAVQVSHTSAFAIAG